MPETRFVLVFESVIRPGFGYSFPCDKQGHVDVSTLPPQAKENYLRLMTGDSDYSKPVIKILDAESVFDM